MIVIEKTDNGYLVKCDENKINEVIEEKETVSEEGSREALQKVLYRVAELLGVYHDKWGKNNLNISFDKKGRKQEEQNK